MWSGTLKRAPYEIKKKKYGDLIKEEGTDFFLFKTIKVP